MLFFELGLRLRELGGDATQARTAFEQAATALEAVIAKGNRREIDRDFHFIMAAASYHLAHLSARAYSLLALVAADENFAPMERVLALLMRRTSTHCALQCLIFEPRRRGSDARIAAKSWKTSIKMKRRAISQAAKTSSSMALTLR